jgi:hypothetical protein
VVGSIKSQITRLILPAQALTFAQLQLRALDQLWKKTFYVTLVDRELGVSKVSSPVSSTMLTEASRRSSRLEIIAGNLLPIA